MLGLRLGLEHLQGNKPRPCLPAATWVVGSVAASEQSLRG